MVDLRAAPFHLDDRQLAWVETTLAKMGPRDRAGQLFVHRSAGFDPDELTMLAALRPGGITRFFSGTFEEESALVQAAQAQAMVPLLVSSDLEGSRMSMPFGTEVPNPLALAAVDDVETTRAIARIMAQEAAAFGVNWTFTPVMDINAAFRSPSWRRGALGRMLKPFGAMRLQRLQNSSLTVSPQQSSIGPAKDMMTEISIWSPRSFR